MTLTTYRDRLTVIQNSPYFDAEWYSQSYPDVVKSGMDPAEHYLIFGCSLQRDPGPNFSGYQYLTAHTEVAKAGLNPLLHFHRQGGAWGYRPRPVNDTRTDLELVSRIRRKLLNLGFNTQPLADLEGLAKSATRSATRAYAAQELAMWFMRQKTPDDYHRSLFWLKQAREAARLGQVDPDFSGQIAVLEIMSHVFLEDQLGAESAWARVAASGQVTPDTMLARVNLFTAPEDRVARLNEVLALWDLAPVSLLPGSAPPYDRLTVSPACPSVTDGPLVSVLVASYDAASTIGTALRSLQEQTWENLEILVLDDKSPDNGRMAEVVAGFAASDPRIRLIEMPENGGAYVARNHGLDLATGDFVTLHDADDWSHPTKIATQMQHMLENPQVIGCTSDQARATNDLGVTRWTGRGQFIIGNTSSFLFRRDVVKEQFGYWDTVRFSADNELIRRIRRRYSHREVTELTTGPLSFQRDSDTSIIASGAFGINGFMFGVRREYLAAQVAHRQKKGNLKYGASIADRPFPVPAVMRPDRKAITTPDRYRDVIFAGDFRYPGHTTLATSDRIKLRVAEGLRVGVVELFHYDLGTPGNDLRNMRSAIRNLIEGQQVEILCFGERVQCEQLIVPDAAVLMHMQRYVPQITAKRTHLVSDGTPIDPMQIMSVLGQVIVDPGTVTWHPLHAHVRAYLRKQHPNLSLATDDWGWEINPDLVPKASRVVSKRNELTIGRLGSERPEDWPGSWQSLLDAYPSRADIRIEVLGHLEPAMALLGDRPGNWTSHPVTASPWGPFLNKLDAVVHIGSSLGPGQPGQMVLQAAAAGVPVILPGDMKELFGDLAQYQGEARIKSCTF